MLPILPREMWSITEQPTLDWGEHVLACNGSVFHTPCVHGVVLPNGQPIFARLTRGNRVIAIASGVALQCRFSRKARHYHFASFPAVADNGNRAAAADDLAYALAARDAAFVGMDSFDVLSRPAGAPAANARIRYEHGVELTDSEEQLRRCGETHRRQIRRGMRSGWQLRSLHGADALELLDSVRNNAADRAHARGSGFDAAPLSAAVGNALRTETSHWGLRCYAAYFEDTPLAAVLIGWAGQRAYYIMGGATVDGYRAGAPVWLHWMIMSELFQRDVRYYNLGGTAADAEQSEHHEHGLFRFKKGFGGTVNACRGLKWELSPAHMRAHKIATAIADRRWLNALTHA